MTYPTLKAYLDWRNEKRAEYKALSTRIRKTKSQIKAIMKEGGYAGTLQNCLIEYRSEATGIMEARKEAKIEARESWDAWMSAKVSVAA